MHTSQINGLVLAGGDSSRMRQDKGLMVYHDKPQREYVFELIAPLANQTFISCRPGQIVDSPHPLLEDKYADLGPFGALMTAFYFYSNHAWLIVACDFPLLQSEGINQLIQSRDANKMATCFLDPKSGLPEPWISILEPAIYPILLHYYQNGKTSLRGVLSDVPVHMITPLDADILLNANTPEEAEALRSRIRDSKK